MPKLGSMQKGQQAGSDSCCVREKRGDKATRMISALLRKRLSGRAASGPSFTLERAAR